MYPHQAERLTAALADAGVEALVATTPANVSYLTGFRSPVQAAYPDTQVYAVFSPRGTALILPARELPAAAAQGAPADRVHPYGVLHLAAGERSDEVWRRVAAWGADPQPTAADALARALEGLGARERVGLDDGGLTPSAWHQLTEPLGDTAVVEASEAFATARQVKGPWEIECLAKALLATEESLNAVIQSLEPGLTERDAVGMFRREALERGAEPWLAWILAGARSAFGAVEPSDRPIKAGDLVRFEVGCAVQGYHATLGRTAVVRQPGARQQAVWDALQAGLEAGIDAVRPGAPADRIFDAVIEATRKAGLADYARGHVGHGVGLEPHERPRLAPGVGVALETGMVLLLHAIHLEPGWGGLGLQETVFVGPARAHALNRSARGLLALD